MSFFLAYCLQIIEACWCSFSDLNFQKSPQVPNWIQIRGLIWPLQNFNIIIKQQLLRRFIYFSLVFFLSFFLSSFLLFFLSFYNIGIKAPSRCWFQAKLRVMIINCFLNIISSSLHINKHVWLMRWHIFDFLYVLKEKNVLIQGPFWISAEK